MSYRLEAVIGSVAVQSAGGFDGLLRSWSARGPLAYAEAEYFGGAGTQAAAVWDGSEPPQHH